MLRVMEWVRYYMVGVSVCGVGVGGWGGGGGRNAGGS